MDAAKQTTRHFQVNSQHMLYQLRGRRSLFYSTVFDDPHLLFFKKCFGMHYQLKLE